MKSLRETVRWMTAATERENLQQVDQKIAARESNSRTPKARLITERAELRRTIFQRLGTELALVTALVTGTAAKLAGVFSTDPGIKTEQLVQPTAKPLDEIDISAPGMLKQFVFENLPKNEKEEEVLQETIGKALTLALQDPEMREVFRKSNIDILVSPNVQVAAQVALERLGAENENINGISLKNWTGDALTLSTMKRSNQQLQHQMMVSESLFTDPLKLSTVIDHELGHIQNRNDRTLPPSLAEEEVNVFSGSIQRLQTLVTKLRTTNGSEDIDAKRLEEEIIPHEQKMLLNWRQKQRR